MTTLTVQEWIDALLSGKYPQTKHRLRDKDGFCCLGVACDLKDSSQWTELTTVDYIPAYWGPDKESHCLPDEIKIELGFNEDQIIELANMNDSGQTFKEIAERIKEYAEENRGWRSVGLCDQ